MAQGKFITFEGCEGVGKSTQIILLKKYFQENNIKALFLREPGGNIISERIREVILDKENKEMTKECEALLYCAARSQLIGQVIKPALDRGEIVICDRFHDSTFAYQGVARNLGIDYISKLNDVTLNGVVPDLTIFLDLDPKSAFERKGGADTNDRLESEKLSFHEKVYEGYKIAAKMYSHRIYQLDCSKAAELVNQDIINVLKERNII